MGCEQGLEWGLRNPEGFLGFMADDVWLGWQRADEHVQAYHILALVKAAAPHGDDGEATEAQRRLGWARSRDGRVHRLPSSPCGEGRKTGIQAGHSLRLPGSWGQVYSHTLKSESQTLAKTLSSESLSKNAF